MDPGLYDLYLLIRNEMSPQRSRFYSDPIHSELRWLTFVNAQRSEQNLINKMKRRFGNEFTVVMGDWNDAGML